MKKLFSTLLLLLLSLSLATAQTTTKAARKNVKKQLSTARDNIRKGTNLEDAEHQMRILLEDSANIDNEKIWLTLFDAIRKQHEALNEALYLKQESDTAKFFTHILHLFDVMESTDSIDSRHRNKHAAYLHPLRKNLYNGGTFYMKRKDYGEAYKYFDTYLSCQDQPLFVSYHFDEGEMATAAVWATYCGYKLTDADKVERYAQLALKDGKREKYVLQYMAVAYAQRDDTVAYHHTLLRGFDKYTDNPFFFKRLAMHYSKNNRHDDVLALAEKLLAVDSVNVAALEAKGSALFHKEQYPECIEVSLRTIDLAPLRSLAYANAGLSFYNQTVPLAQKKQKTREDTLQLRDLYIRALPYLEKERQMEPTAVDLWGIPLYNIYFNLNMGDEFEEMEKILSEPTNSNT